jgi:hypothetical protein
MFVFDPWKLHIRNNNLKKVFDNAFVNYRLHFIFDQFLKLVHKLDKNKSTFPDIGSLIHKTCPETDQLVATSASLTG